MVTMQKFKLCLFYQLRLKSVFPNRRLAKIEKTLTPFLNGSESRYEHGGLNVHGESRVLRMSFAHSRGGD